MHSTPSSRSWNISAKSYIAVMPIDQDEQVAAVDDSWFGEPSVLAVHEWLQSSEGQSMIARTLRAYRLPPSFDADVERMVIRSAAGAISRGKTIDSPPAWATNCIRNRTKDLFRSPKSRLAPRRERDGEGITDDEARFGSAVDDHSIERFENAQVADVVRRRLLSAGTHGWRVAAGLAVVAYDVDQAEPECEVPTTCRGCRGAGVQQLGRPLVRRQTRLFRG